MVECTAHADLYKKLPSSVFDVGDGNAVWSAILMGLAHRHSADFFIIFVNDNYFLHVHTVASSDARSAAGVLVG